MTISKKIEIYKEKVQGLSNPHDQVVTNPHTILADLLRDYLNEYADQNLFARRMLVQLDDEKYNLLANLNAYFTENHVSKDPAKKAFIALIIAYFYYFGDCYLLAMRDLTHTYPGLRLYVYDPLQLYKDNEKVHQLEQYLTALTTEHDAFSAFRALMKNRQIPSKGIPFLITTLTEYMKRDKIKFDQLYPLFFNYAAEDKFYMHPQSVRFSLPSDTQDTLIAYLLKGLERVEPRVSVIAAMFLVAPESSWHKVLKGIMAISPYCAGYLDAVLRSHFRTTKNEALMDTVIQTLLDALDHPGYGVAETAISALLNGYVPERFHVTIVKKLLPRFTDFVVHINIHSVITNEATQALIKPMILRYLKKNPYETVRLLGELPDLFTQDNEINSELNQVIKTTSGIEAVLQNYRHIRLDNATISKLLQQMFSDHHYQQLFAKHPFAIDFVQKLNTLCKTEIHFRIVIDAMLKYLSTETLASRMLQAFSVLNYPDCFNECITTVAIRTLNQTADVKEAFCRLLPKLMIPHAKVDEITDMLISATTETPARLSCAACKSLQYWYERHPDKKNVIQTTLLNCLNDERNEVCKAAVSVLAKFPDVVIKAETACELLRTAQANQYSVLPMLASATITGATNTFIDRLIRYLIRIECDEATAKIAEVIIVKVSSSVALSGVVDTLLHLAEEYPLTSVILTVQALLQALPLSGSDAIKSMQAFLPRIYQGDPVTRRLFDRLMPSLSYAARCGIFAALDNQVKGYNTFIRYQVEHFIEEIRYKYLYIPLQIKSLHFEHNGFAPLPEEIKEHILSYNR